MGETQMSARTIVFPQDNCPNCQHELDAVKAIDNLPAGSPKAGDITICAYCHAILMWNVTMKLEKVFSGISVISKHDC
jgi:hypothetical protein